MLFFTWSSKTSSPSNNASLAGPSAKPSLCAALITPTATAAEIARGSLKSGKHCPARNWSSRITCTSASLAAMNIRSVTTGDLLNIAPKATPGKMNTLLPWFDFNVRPLYSTSGNGEPVATIAFPPVASCASCGVVSLFEVGLDNGKINGLKPSASANSPTCFITPAENMPPTPLKPKSTVALARRTVVARSAPSCFSSGRASFRRCGSKSSRALVTRPLMSSIQKLSQASSSVRPWMTMARIN
mmetsp:Transcript_82518/g.161820  ORF Transcript_82518/g.161820 Transcript_82518/m.161820 type:complete len:244 (+) Transcript_82518:306-1037(+)